MIPVIDLILHVDHYLPEIIGTYGIWVYGIIFTLIFLESALVIFPYLPGDSLLFVTGALSAIGLLDLGVILISLITAVIIGGVVNYLIGRFLGTEILAHEWRLVRKEYIEETHTFFEKYGGFTIVIARFIPFVRSFAPFFAGLGLMNFNRFFLYNVTGGLIWVPGFVLGGYFFGNLPVVRDNFSLVILVIIGLSLVPAVPLFVKMFSKPGNPKK
jgi:membrane-associated protein